MLSRSTVLTIGIALATLVCGRADAGTVYSVTDGFTGNSTAFSYGRLGGGSLSGAFSQFTESGNIGTYTGNSAYDPLLYLKDSGSIDPNVIYNSSASTISTGSEYGDITFNSHELTFGPFLGPTVARFTAATAGTYDISALFTPVQVANSTPNYYVFINGVVSSALASSSYIGSTYLNAGGTIDFVVFGGNSNNKTTQVDATVTAVPEPATWAMSGLATILVTGAVTRRKRKSQIIGV